MKSFLALTLLSLSLASFANLKCEDIAEIETESMGSFNILNKDNWKSIDVISNMDYESCKNAISQTLFKFEGELYWKFASYEDECDGGNTYGVIYSYDLKTPIAHIYDSDTYCENDWREDERAISHQCDDAAEKLAEERMKSFGLDFKAVSSGLTINRPYIYSYIDVEGVLVGKENKPARVRVLTEIGSCKFASVRIEDIEI